MNQISKIFDHNVNAQPSDGSVLYRDNEPERRDKETCKTIKICTGRGVYLHSNPENANM
ncbi:hypothetical protein HanPI659440_Chr10g0381401 [Helianthus annuus]|nr:hypothetical protein HanPI659440_Chr10g0381401 [Helianthus annuus]